MLSSKQLKAIELILHGKNQKEVAKELKVSDRTVRNWLKKPEFVSELKRRQREALEEFVLSLTEIEEDIDSALKETMRKLLEGVRDIDPSTPQGLNALSTAFKALLEYKQKQKEYVFKVWERKKKEEEEEVKNRLQELEKKIEVVIKEVSGDANRD